MRKSVTRLSPLWRIATIPSPANHTSPSRSQIIHAWSVPSIPPRAGESSTSRYFHTSSSKSTPSRQPDKSRDLHSTAWTGAAAQPLRSDEYDQEGVIDWNWDEIPLDNVGIPTRPRNSHPSRLDPELEGYDLSPLHLSPEAELDDIPSFVDDHASYDPQPMFEEYDPTVPTGRKRTRRKRTARRELPPLPVGEFPPDGESRFDWRETSLSSGLGEGIKRKEGKIWYPHLGRVRRVEAEKGVLEVGDVFYDEVERYEKHFKPLLQAEYDETERMVMQRLQDWSLDRLIKEGSTLDTMTADRFVPPKRVEGEIWTFHQGKGDAKKPLPFHKFEIGSYVFLSRTNPCVDPVLEDGTIRTPSEEEEAEEAEINPTEWLRAKVYSRAKHYVRIQLPNPVQGMGTGRWRLDLGMSDWSLQVQLQAIKALHNDPVMQDMHDMHLRSASISRSKPKPIPVKTTNQYSDGEDEAIDSVFAMFDQAKDRRDETILNGIGLRDILLRAFQAEYLPLSSTPTTIDIAPTIKPTDIDATPLPSSTPNPGTSPRGILARDQLIQSWATRHATATPLSIEGDPLITLNPTQTRAIAMILSNRISLVQGPPGTGKTRVIVEVIKLLKRHFRIPHPILVCAHTNVAVDNLLAPLREQGVKAIRCGSRDRVREDLKQWTMETMVEGHPLFPEVDALRTDLEATQRRIGAGGPELNFKWEQEKVKGLRSRIYGLSSIMNREVLLSGDVICTTLLSAASRKLSNIDFPIVFIDEASMATEPLTILALMKGASHVAIIGDHKQLPPVIISPEAHAGGLATSLFERLIHEKNIPSIMLDTQYRMHPDISAFPNRAFYAGALHDGTTHEGVNFDPPISAYLVPDSNITFLDHYHPETPQSASLANHGDANIVSNIIADLLYHNKGLKGSQIGVITAYSAQVRVVSDKLTGDPDRLLAFKDLIGEEGVKELADIEIKTVDGFQGREKEIMIVSMVRCNPGGWVGFLGDWRRLNVALTRARRALFIVGSASTLEKARYGKVAAEQLPPGGANVLRDHIRHLRKEGLIMPAAE